MLQEQNFEVEDQVLPSVDARKAMCKQQNENVHKIAKNLQKYRPKEECSVIVDNNASCDSEGATTFGSNASFNQCPSSVDLFSSINPEYKFTISGISSKDIINLHFSGVSTKLPKDNENKLKKKKILFLCQIPNLYLLNTKIMNTN